ncbi:MAG: UbiD family decarboxylase [Dehalococcoidia bacterium]|nr:UbiD family decarboxylase [Dehalococcoidia bacterium]
MDTNLRSFLGVLEDESPQEIVRIDEPVDAANFEATAILQLLENRGQYPLVVFERPKDLNGEISRFPLVTNVYASRRRCAVALGLPEEAWALPLSLEYARRETGRVAPKLVSRQEAAVTEETETGEDIDLRKMPIVRHHRMDAAPYIDMTAVMRDPETGAYNAAFLRTMYRNPRQLALYMSPRHNWQIARRYEEAGRDVPVALVVSHHPAFHLGSLNVAPFGQDDYQVIGAIMQHPLNLTPSASLGSDFLIPADADLVIEGRVIVGARDAEGPFGEFPGYYGPQRLSRVIEVTAINHRSDAMFQDVFVGHRDNWIIGAIPKEGSLYNRVKGVVPSVKGVHFPNSGTGRYNCYVSIDKKVNGESKQAALIILGECDFVKNIIVVDADIDPFDEEKVLWAVATRTQADRDLDVIKNVKGNPLDPSQTDDIMTAKLLIDATMPVTSKYAARVDVPADVLQRIHLEKFLPGGVPGS